jgi:cephalosporin hydroxylase
MKVTIDIDSKTLSVSHNGKDQSHDLFSKEAFEHIARLWVDVGWVRKYPYSFSWLGRPIIQLPDDMISSRMT